MNWIPRQALETDIPALELLIPRSVRALQAGCYPAAVREAAIGTVFAVDRQLIADETYWVVESEGCLVGGGGWSRRQAICGGDHGRTGLNPLLDPRQDSARIRAFFVHPKWARRGIGRSLLERCEKAAWAAGFRRAELVATLAGNPLYLAHGYQEVERFEVTLDAGLKLPVIRMAKELANSL